MAAIQFVILLNGLLVITVIQQVASGGHCKCDPTDCSSCSSQEMTACGRMCKGNGMIEYAPIDKRASTIVSQLSGPWFLTSSFSGIHDVTCVQVEDIDVDGQSYPAMMFNVHDTLNPDQIIMEESWHLMFNGNNLELAPERIAWCEERFSSPCPIDVWYDEEFVVGRYWEDGIIGNGTFEFVFEFTRDQFEK